MQRQTITHYELLEPLGRGGMGVVHRAKDLKLGRTVALKFLSPDLLESEDARARFQREARALSSLSHPHIATVYEVDEEAGKPFMAMEYLSGGTLRARVEAARVGGTRLTDAQCLEWGIGLAEGLAHAHSKGVIHRDVKCSNAMFDEEGRIKLTDFGLAKDVAGGDTTGAVVGTVEYMSPEQLSGGAVDHRSDLYSLGVVLYELATGQLPFSGRSPLELANKIVSADPPRVSLVRPDVAPAFEQVVSRLLSKSAEDRYQRARDVLDDLERVRSQPSGWSQLPTQTLRPARRRVGGKTMAAVTIGSIAVLGFVLRPTPPPLPENKHVLVMPLRSIGGDANQQALCDGLTETLTTALTQTGLLSVVAPSDARKVETVQQARKEFGVNLVLAGSLQPRGDQVRLTVNLSDAEKQVQLGAETIEAPAGQPLQIEEGMLAKVADLIDIAVPQSDSTRSAASASLTPAAFDSYLRGRGYLYRYDKAGNLERALQQFDDATRSDPQFALAYAGLGEANLRIYRQRREKPYLDAARAASERAVALSPSLAAAHVTIGAVLAESGQSEAAVVELEKSIELDPREPAAYRELAPVYGTLGKQDRAEDVYKKAIQSRPGDWRSYANLAAFYYNQQHYADAERLYRKVIELTPDNHLGYRNLGGVLFALGKNDDAEAMFKKAQSLNPTARSASNLGTLYMFEERYADAVPILEDAATLAARDVPNEYRIWGNLGDAYALAGAPSDKSTAAYAKAVEIAERLRSGKPETPDLASMLAEYYAKLGNKTLALQRIEAAIGVNAKSASVRFEAGKVFAVLGDETRALKELKEAVAGGYAVDEIRRSPDLKKLRQHPDFAKILAYAPANS